MAVIFKDGLWVCKLPVASYISQLKCWLRQVYQTAASKCLVFDRTYLSSWPLMTTSKFSKKTAEVLLAYQHKIFLSTKLVAGSAVAVTSNWIVQIKTQISTLQTNPWHLCRVITSTFRSLGQMNIPVLSGSRRALSSLASTVEPVVLL